ncbi:GntR family transcriptional regulator [Dactylosporangium aurantiacum]|uniref:GntR family transcriptional regulator n=1 Tax=Dactylosporangium aurantiacum TaxID=35754 RepID=A0A9Q9IGS8_9ACTN|nr:GntR family transcriptional regulator [Dactylosporangium aurantiacum]MDG6108806.1 GntR family transcriptional regulator [Dactylosporangium aurantiacum]UWZ55787.1 GntR family transcriptional regulator [Dactylosporangium aurantiacum]
MLTPQSGQAQYQQLADVLRNRIDQDFYYAGATLPTEAALCFEFEVGRMMVRRALAVLREEGLILTRRGEAAIVRPRTIRTEVGLRPRDSVIARMPSRPERAALGMQPGVPLVEVRRAGGGLEVFAADQAELVALPLE